MDGVKNGDASQRATACHEWADRWIDFEGRDENGDKVYAVQYEGHDVGTFQTYDEAVIALREYVAWARFGTLQRDAQ